MMRQIIACLLACLVISAGLIILKQPTKTHEVTASGTSSGTYIQKVIEVRDYYPEGNDGIRNIYVAIIYQDFGGDFEVLIPKIVSIGQKILSDGRIHGEWNVPGYPYPDVFGDGELVTLSKFESYIATIDSKTDGDDRLILFIVGHGNVRQDEYVLKLEDGTEIPEDTLRAYLATLGPALDFVWLFSCYSEVFGFHQAENLSESVKEYILWSYHGETEINTMALQASNFYSALDQGITKIENIYSFHINTVNLTQFDEYPGYLDIPSLGPVYEEPTLGSVYGVVFIPLDQTIITPL